MKTLPPRKPEPSESSKPHIQNHLSPKGGKSPPPERGKIPNLKWFSIFATVWVAVIVCVWFALHNPFSVEFPLPENRDDYAWKVLTALANLGLDSGLVGLVTLASGATGGWLLETVWPGGRELSRAEKLVFSIGLGLGVNIMLLLGVGVLGGVNSWMAYGLLLAELALLWRWRSRLNLVGVARQELTEWWGNGRWWEKALALWIGLAALLTLLVALAPPLSWDSLMYHLEGPKRYIEAGRIEPLPRLGQASFPFGAEMLFLWGMLLHSDGLAQGFSWLYGLLGAAGCMLVARRFFTQLGAQRARQAGLLAAALYLSIPHVWLLMTWAYTDTMLAFYTLLAFYALLLAVERAGEGRLAGGYAALAGVMAGLACGGKYTAIIGAFGAVGGVLVFVGLGRPRPTYRQLALGGLIFAVFGTLSFAPWLVRNIVFSGNPVAPLFWGIQGWEAEEIAALTGKDGGVNLSLDVILGRPFLLVLTGRNNGIYDATLSPLFLALLPLGIWAAFRARFVAATWLAVGINYIGWLVGIRLSGAADHTRLMLPVFPLLALITAYAVVDFLGHHEWLKQVGPLRQVTRLVVGSFLVTGAFAVGLFFVESNPLSFHFGLQTRAERLESQLGPLYRASAFVNQNLPKDAKLFLFLEPRSYYFERPLSPDHNLGGQFFLYTTRYKTPEAIHAELKRRGASHALVSNPLLQQLTTTPFYRRVEDAKAGIQLLADLEAQGYFEKLYDDKGVYTIYRLR